MHPLAPNLTELSDVELHKKHGELVQRLTQAYRIGPYNIIGQLQMLLEDYNVEIQRRNQKHYEEILQKSKNKTGIIDIK
jgi:hypothetical protein